MFRLQSEIQQQKNSRIIHLLDTTGMYSTNNSTGFGIENGIQVNEIGFADTSDVSLTLVVKVITPGGIYTTGVLDLYNLFHTTDDFGNPIPWVHFDELQFALTTDMVFGNNPSFEHPAPGDPIFPGNPIFPGHPNRPWTNENVFPDGIYEFRYEITKKDANGDVSLTSYSNPVVFINGLVTRCVFERIARLPIQGFNDDDFRRPDVMDTMYSYMLLRSLDQCDLATKKLELIKGLRLLQKYCMSPCKSRNNDCSWAPRF